MQLHPLNLTKADAATISQPPSPNPLLDTNPFGAVPLSALVQTPTASLKKKQAPVASADEGHLAAALEASSVYTPQGRAKGEDEDVQRAPQAFIFQRQAAIPATSFQDLINQQVGNDLSLDPAHAQAHTPPVYVASLKASCAVILVGSGNAPLPCKMAPYVKK